MGNTLVQDPGGRWAAVQIEWTGIVITLVCVYAPAALGVRSDFLSSLSHQLPADAPNLLVMGDFNCTRDAIADSSNAASTCHKTGRAELEQFMMQRGLHDIWRAQHPDAKEFTGPSRMGHRGRIDITLVDEDLSHLISESEILPQRDAQQHSPILATLFVPTGPQRSKKRAPWKLKPETLKIDGLEEHLISFGEALLEDESDASDPGARLERVRNSLIAETRRREKSHATAVDEATREDRSRLSVLYGRQQLLGDPNVGAAEIHSIRLRILSSKQRASQERMRKYRVEERTDADRPTKGFLSAARARADRTNIPALINPVTKERTTNLTGMAKIARNFWGNISRSPDTGSTPLPIHLEDRNFFLDMIQGKLTPEEAYNLGRNIHLGEFDPEISETGRLLDPGILQSLPTCRAPGQDGVSYEWYRMLWPVLGSLLVNAWNHSQNSDGKLPKTSRVALIQLIFKGSGDPENISNYRPIALLAAEYKLLARCLSRRLLPLMERLVHPDQTYGIAKRSIEQNIRTKADILHWCDQLVDNDYGPLGRAPGGIGMLDIDFSKAFDSVDIDFLVEVCQRFGLGDGFCRWIKLFYFDATAKVVVNGKVCDPYRLACGIRQGCPISSLLFTLVVEAFAIAVRSDPAIAGVSLNGGPGWPTRELRLQQYADDLTLYFRGLSSTPRLMQLLYSFGRATNLHMNELKTVGIYFGLVDPQTIPALANITWLKEGEQRTSLGIAVGKRLDIARQSLAIEERVMRALRHLRGLARSIYSRAMLAQVKVVSIVVFYARVTCIDSECLKRMQTALDDYIWLSNAPESVRHADKGRRVQRHVKASAVYSPVENGGLPVQRLENVVAANLAWAIRKWLPAKRSTEKYLPRHWVAEAHWPRSLGFSAVLQDSPRLPPTAPRFYHMALQAWKKLNWIPVPVASLSQLESTPLWNNAHSFPLSSTVDGTDYLAHRGLRYVGQFLTPGTRIAPNFLPADLEGLRRPPHTESILLRPVLSSRLRKDIANAARSWDVGVSPQPVGPATLFATFQPLQDTRWLPNDAPPDIAQIWAAPPPVEGAASLLVRQSSSGVWESTGSSRVLPIGIVDRALCLSRNSTLNVYGAGDSDETRFQLPHEGSGKPILLADCGVKNFYKQLNLAWIRKSAKDDPAGGSGLQRHLRWVESSGNRNPQWFKPVFRSLRSRLLSSEERSLLWQTMHSDGRFGYRIRSETRADVGADADCPFCGPDRAHPEDDPGETMEHAYGTCPGLDDLWAWAAATFLLPAGGQHAAPHTTSAIQDPGKTRRALVGRVLPHILSGLLGVIKLDDKHNVLLHGASSRQAQDALTGLHAWWSMIRASILAVVESQRQAARRGREKYNVPTVARPPLRVTKECILLRLRERVLEENVRVEDNDTLHEGALLANILGRCTETQLLLSPLLGGAKVTRTSGSNDGPPAPRLSGRRPEADWRRPSPPPADSKHCYMFFDGASQNNPGPAACGCVLRSSDGQNILLRDFDYVGRTTNNEAEYCGLILGLHRAASEKFTAISIRGDSSVVVDQISGRARCKTRGLSDLLERALTMLKPRIFPHGIDIQWVRRNANSDADALANLGLKHRIQTKRSLFYAD
jgi:ribonuclease HI